MSTEVVMPQMGESIAEGTIVRWIKKVGESVERDEPLFEISTDKVDAEIPSPVAGILTEIRTAEGETVPVNSVVAVIGGTGLGASAPPASQEPASTAAEAGSVVASTTQSDGDDAPRSTDEGAERRTSPVVRRIAKEQGVDLAQVRGTGAAGRVTRDDILAVVAGRDGVAAGSSVQSVQRLERPSGSLAGQVVPMSVMRRKIAEHMIASQRTSAHVHTVFEIGFERVAAIRKARKAEFERAGVKLTYLAFIIRSAASALRAVPIVNASVDGNDVIYHEDVNIGVAVALDWGLVVPVIRHADRANLLDLSRTIADLAERARSKHLKPEEVTGGTFTVTNPGVHGALFGTPIINQPQVAILGVGNIEKRPVVVDDALGVGLTAHVSLGFDHRVIDGVVADQFMAHLKHGIESWEK